MQDRMEELLLKLYNNPEDRYYSHLFFQVDRVACGAEESPTMGVGVVEGRIKLFYNTDFLAGLTDNQAVVILKHEVLHLINDHLTRGTGAKEKDMTKHQMENIAMDCAINQYLDGAVIEKIGGVTLQKFRELLTHRNKSFQIKPKMTMDYYLALLQEEREKREENGEGGQGSGSGKSFEEQLKDLGMDDHGNFGEMDALDKAMLEDKMRKAAENAKADGAGRLPSEIEELLKLRKKPTVSWKREIRQFIGHGIKMDRTSSRSRRNRRYGITFAGHKKDYRARILVVLDTSGSMYGDRTDKVLNELYGIYKANNDMELDIVECDAKIQEVFKYDGKDTFKISGRGGTYLSPSLKYAQDNKYDGVVVLTDGEFFNEEFEKYNKIQSLWLIAQNKSYTSPIGRTIHVK